MTNQSELLLIVHKTRFFNQYVKFTESNVCDLLKRLWFSGWGEGLFVQSFFKLVKVLFPKNPIQVFNKRYGGQESQNLELINFDYLLVPFL